MYRMCRRGKINGFINKRNGGEKESKSIDSMIITPLGQIWGGAMVRACITNKS